MMIYSGEEDDVAGCQEQGLLEESATFVVAGVEVNPAQRGYTAVHNYALYFWRPYLGNTAFGLWELLLSFCWGEHDTAHPSISRLARMLTNSDYSRAVVTGRRRADRAGEVVEGALNVLCRERLVQVMRQGSGTMSHYTFRVLKTLPLLRPEQVARLSPGLQRDHVTWLARHGIRPAAYRQAFAAADGPAATSPCPTQQYPYAPGSSPCAPRTTGDAPGTGGCAPDNTNNPQGEFTWKYWWQDALNELRPQLTRSTFDMCLLRTKVGSFQDGVLTLHAAGPLARESLRHRLAPLIERTLHAASSAQVQRVVVE